jgi:cytochrome c biogenesis factor
MDKQQETLDAAISAVGSKVTYAGSAGSVVSWLTSNEGGVVMGLAIAILGLAVNVFFKLREDRRQQEEHNERMALLRAEAHE